jgi:hypothetical protein
MIFIKKKKGQYLKNSLKNLGIIEIQIKSIGKNIEISSPP